jgi:hypothetical protein
MEDSTNRRGVVAPADAEVVRPAPGSTAVDVSVGRIGVPRGIQLALGLLAVLLVLEIAGELSGLPGPSSFYEVWLGTALLAGCAAVCLARAWSQPVHRAAWGAIAAGMLCWTLGTVVWEAQYSGVLRPPYPSDADVLWLLWYPLTAVGIALLMKARVTRFEADRWMDGLVVMLLVLAAAFPITLHPVEEYLGSDKLAGLVNISYPVLDTVLLGAILGTFAMIAWRPDPAWVLIGLGVAAMTIGDAAFAVEQARGVSEGVDYGFVWSAGAVMVACASWIPDVHRYPRRELYGWSAIALPLFAAVLAVALQFGVVFLASFHTTTHKVAVLVVLVIAVVQLILTRPREDADRRRRVQEDVRLRSVRSGEPIPVAPTGRQATARRLEAARVLAGRPSLRALASQTGMSYPHLVAVANGSEPLLPTDARDLGRVLDVPEAWLRDGWSGGERRG